MDQNLTPNQSNPLVKTIGQSHLNSIAPTFGFLSSPDFNRFGLTIWAKPILHGLVFIFGIQNELINLVARFSLGKHMEWIGFGLHFFGFDNNKFNYRNHNKGGKYAQPMFGIQSNFIALKRS